VVAAERTEKRIPVTLTCPRCRCENAAGAKFCEECGAPLLRQCAACGHPLSATAKFCPECAQPASVGAARSTSRRFESPDSYTPKHLAEKILTSKSSLEGERKQVTVLFADLKGSMELLAERDPEDARALLDPVLEHMIEAVHRFEGTVNQVMGDGIMALFGAPLAHEDHAVRACYAALRMQETVKRYAEERYRSHGITVRIRVGLNSGEVVVRAIRSDLRTDYTAVGRTTHLAARMEQLADPGTTLLTPASYRLVEGYVDVRRRSRVSVKGLAEPMEVYELVGTIPIRSRFRVAAARGLTRFAGRAREFDRLGEALGRAGAGHGQVVAVVGEPGVGKSRLCWEFTHSPRAQRWLVLETGATSSGKAAAYSPVIDLLKAYFQVEARDGIQEMREKVTAKLAALGAPLTPDVPAFLSLVGLPTDDAPWERLEPLLRRQRILDGVRRLLIRMSQVQPLVLLFEDLHWIDGETQALLDNLVESLPTARLLLLVTYRGEYEHGWGRKTYYEQLRIDPLPTESADDLLANLLGTDAGLGTLKRVLIDRTEGNPLFLEESVRSLVETGALTGERGAHRLADNARAIQVPQTVEAILAARIDRLSPEDKRLLQGASVIGKEIPFRLLQATLEVPEIELRQGLIRLQAAEFLYEARLFPDLEHTFKHALTHEVAYGSLLQERRRVLHARVVRAMEHLYADRLTVHAEQLVRHALRGEEWARAARYCCVAGGRAMAQARYEAGAALYEAAIRAIDRQGNEGDLSSKLDAALELWAARVEAGRAEGFEELGEQAEALARALNDRPRLAQVRLRQAQGACFVWVGPDGLETAIQRARDAFDLADRSDMRTRSYARFLVGAASLALGRFRMAIREFDAGVELFTPIAAEAERLILPIRASLRAWQAEAYATLGEFEAALAAAAEAQRIANEIEHPQSRWLAAAYAGHVLLTKGEIEAAAATYRSGLAVAEDNELMYGVRATSLGLAHCQCLLGLHEEGTQRLPRDPQPWEALGLFSRTVGRYGALKAGAYLAAGLLDEAEAEITHGLARATAEGARGFELALCRLRAEALSRRGGDHRDQAGIWWRRSVDLAANLGARPELAHAHLGLGGLLRDTGAVDRAREHLATAVALYRELGMTYWLVRTEADMRQRA
jgi:class 3 adenylate cyclase/tetratricopeptide (TPR) repeat protein